MSDNAMRVPSRSLKEQFSKGSDAWKEQSDPIFRFWTEGDWWGFPFFSLSASRYFGYKETLCLYWPVSLLAGWDRRHHRSEGAGFLRWVLCSPGNFTPIRRERHPFGDDGAELRSFARRLRRFILTSVSFDAQKKLILVRKTGYENRQTLSSAAETAPAT